MNKMRETAGTIAELNHKYVHRRLTSVVSRVTDLVPFAMSDIIIAIYRYPLFAILFHFSPFLEPLFRGMQRRLWPQSKRQESDKKEQGITSALVVFGYMIVVAILPFFRIPLWKKLGITPIAFDLLEELEAVKHLLLQAYDEAGGDVEVEPQWLFDRVREFTVAVDGYDFRSTQVAKTSRFALPPEKAKPARALMNPLISEIVLLVQGEHPVSITHEAIHSRGILPEPDTVFGTVVVLITSDDPRLRFWGFQEWFNRLLSVQQEGFNRKEYLKSSRLSEEIIAFFRRPKPDKSKWLAKIATALSRAGQKLVFILSGLNNAQNAYVNRPLQILAGYRQTHLNA